MKSTLLIAMLAVIGLTACEKTTVNPPSSTTVVAPTVEKQVAVPVAVPGPAGAPGATGATGAAGEPGKAGDTIVVLPEEKK